MTDPTDGHDTTSGGLPPLAAELMRAVTSPMLIVSADGRVLAANQAAAALSKSPGDAPGQTGDLMDFLPGPLSEIILERLAKVLGDGRARDYQDDAEGRVLSMRLSALHTGGQTLAVIHIQDLTGRIRAEEDLRRERQRQIFLLEALPGFVFLMNRDKQIRYANRTFRRLFGRYKGRTCRQTIGHTPGTCDACRVMDGFESMHPVNYECTIDGHIYEMFCHPMTDIDGSVHMLVMGLDITGRKNAEAKLHSLRDELEERVRLRTLEMKRANLILTREIDEHRRTEEKLKRASSKAQAATRAKSAFLANMSHEIRTPLNAIIGMTDLARRALNGKDLDRRLEVVREAGSSLLTVINDILDFSKVEARKLTLEAIPFDLHRIMASAVDIQALNAKDKGLELVLVPPGPEVPARVTGDPGRLAQVLNNLLGNAVKFTESGRVELSVARTEKTPGTDPGSAESIHLAFTVKDTGIGIPQDKREDIFQSFEQADGSVTRRYGGSGLGLAISRHLAELMGGGIVAEPNPGGGSTFTFRAVFSPADEAEACGPDPDRPPCPGDLGELRILLVEDAALNRELMEIFLSDEGFDAACATNGREALDMLAERPFDLILMDVQMPVMDGLSVVKAIRSGQPPLAVPRDVPIIALTAHALKDDRKRFLEAGMDGYVPKPVDLDHLLAVMAEVMGMAGANRPPRKNHPGRRQPGQPLFPDRQGALDLMGGNPDLLERLEKLFQEDAPEQLRLMDEALARGDGTALKDVAHRFKGSAATIGARETARLALGLEQAASATMEKQTLALKRLKDHVAKNL